MIESKDYEIELPDIFPLDKIVVDGEQHIYRVFEGSEGPLPEEEYTLDKAPIEEIKKVTGTIDGEEESEFEKGVDYKLSADSERLLWLNGDRPDPGTVFYVTYNTSSIISRYVESGEEELETIENIIADAIEGKLLSTAEGVELDRIGGLFGPVIGNRRGRTDEQYRIYLKSVVQSFVSRGTKEGIKLAISAATDVSIENITIKENFENNEYSIVVFPNTPVNVAVLQEIAEIADPSGIKLLSTRFRSSDTSGVRDSVSIPDAFQSSDTSGVRDSVSIPDAFQSSDSLAVNDSVDNFGFNGVGNSFDEIAIQESISVNPNRATTSDKMFGNDTFAIDQNQTTESLSIDESVTVDVRLLAWEQRSWNNFNWTG